MKKITIFLLVTCALVAGYVIGNRTDLFSSRPAAPPYMYNFQLPKELSGENAAFSEVANVISPVVANISTSKTVARKGISPNPHSFDGPFHDYFESFDIPKKWKEQSLGSGVVVSSDGYIITNNHVVEKSDEIKVTLFDQQNYKGKIIGTDPKTDLAVIKISATNLPAIKWGDSDKLWNPDVLEWQPSYQGIADMVMANNPNIKVAVGNVPEAEFANKITAMIAATMRRMCGPDTIPPIPPGMALSRSWTT